MAKSARGLDSDGLWNFALRALGARAHSAGELRLKLERRAARVEDVAAVVRRLKESGYLDDRRFAEAFTTSRLENEGFGKRRVLQDLRKRRVAPAVAGATVDRAYAETDETKLAEAYLKRKFRSVALDSWLAEPKHLASAYRRLRGAGFSGSTAVTVLKRFAAEPEVLDSLDVEDLPEEPE